MVLLHSHGIGETEGRESLRITDVGPKGAGFSVAFCWTAARQAYLRNVDFDGRTKMFVSLFQIRRLHIFDPFHECADSARQIAPMCYDEPHGER